MSEEHEEEGPLIGVLALQGAFEEHQRILEALGCKTVQVRTASQLTSLSGLILPGGESTAMGLIGNGELWTSLRKHVSSGKPTWGTCAGMILLAERCVGTSAVIENGQSLIGGVEALACRNYFGSQISSFETGVPPPPGYKGEFKGVFIRAPAILNVYGEGVEVLAKVVAAPCRHAAKVLDELESKISNGKDVFLSNQEEKKEVTTMDVNEEKTKIVLPGAAEGSTAREVICAVQKGNILCTAFHPELTNDYRWHQYFIHIVKKAASL